LIRARRCALNLTQKQIADRVKVSASYICNLEAGRRHPSAEAVTKLADVLGLDSHDLFLFTIPNIAMHLSDSPPNSSSRWESVLKDKGFLETHRISTREVAILSRVSTMGEVRSAQDVVFILNTIRRALRKSSG
jgi:transcriptional regulator with XRE-family HTH domain